MYNHHLQIRETEYLVVGAGAAGCAFGFLMERAGADVLWGELGRVTSVLIVLIVLLYIIVSKPGGLMPGFWT